MHCPLCQRTMQPWFASRDYRRPHLADTWSVVWCESCQYGAIGEKVSPDEVMSFYPDNYYTHTEAGGAKGPPLFTDRLRTHLAWRMDRGSDFTPAEIELTGAASPPTICEIGCGGGDQLRPFKALGFTCTGVDPDQKALLRAKDIGDIHFGTAESLPGELSGRTFDVVLFYHVLEHCIDPVAALANARRLMKPGATLVIEVPNSSAEGLHRFEGTWPWADIPRHLHFFTERSLDRILDQSGLEMSRVLYTGFTRHFNAEWRAWQKSIHAAIATGPEPKYAYEAWLELARSPLASRATKYDSIRVHARLA